MGQPAARLTDMHICPMQTPAIVPIPHVGGPIVGPGCPTVLIGGMPAAVMGDMLICVGPPDTIILGSSGVMFGGKPAARMGDQCAHGGAIILGCPTVLIGETGSGDPAPAPGALVAALVDEMGEEEAFVLAQMQSLISAATYGTPFCEECEKKKSAERAKNNA